jgi:transcriptional regulator with XRE-family HTH domain
MEFSEKLQAIRKKLLISQEVLAHEIGVSFATVNRLERGLNLPSLLTQKRFKEYCKKNKIKFNEKGEIIDG